MRAVGHVSALVDLLICDLRSLTPAVPSRCCEGDVVTREQGRPWAVITTGSERPRAVMSFPPDEERLS